MIIMAVVGWLLFIILLPFVIAQNIGIFSLMIFTFVIASGLAKLAKQLEKEQIKKESKIISSKKWENFDWDYK